jgi:hypothetical protein
LRPNIQSLLGVFRVERTPLRNVSLSSLTRS